MAERIRSSSEQNIDGCWLWLRTIQREGYGKITIRVDGKPATRLAHRVSYETFVAPIPDGLWIDHLCRVRSCVNPAHLEPVTPQQNVRRSPIHAANFRKDGKCSSGHVLSEVGTYKSGDYDACKACGKRNQAKSRAKRMDRQTAQTTAIAVLLEQQKAW